LIKAPLKALRRNRLKTSLIYLSLTVAICAIFVITAVANGLISMYSQIIQTDGDIIVTQKGIADTFFSDVNRALVPRIEQLPGIQRVQAIIVGASPIETIPIAGIYGLSDNRMGSYDLIEGRPPGPGEAMLGSTIASILAHPKEISISNHIFRVSGVFQTGVGFEDGGAVIPVVDAGEIFHRSASFFLITLDPDADPQTLTKQISALDVDIEAKQTEDFVKHYNQFKIISTSANVISAVAFFMGLLGIVNMMYMVVNDRRSEFGILRAIGISKLAIVWMLMLEALAIATFSFATALGLSEVILHVLANLQKFQGYVSGRITLDLMFGVFIAAVTMALLGSLLPALRASRTDPILLIQRGA